MRQGRGMWYLLVLAVCFSLTACDPYAYYPGRSRPITPPPGPGAPPAPAPGTAATPTPGPTPTPPLDLAQQVQDLQARVQQLEARLAELEGQPPAAPPPAAPAPKGPGPKVKEAPPGYLPPSGEQNELYVEGYRLYQKKKYGPARAKFAEYLQSQPRGPKAPEARYFLAYSFRHEGKPKEAAMEFNKLVTQFPRSRLAPAATMQQALAYKSLNRNKLYESTLQKLMKNYPQSPEAQEARKLLKEGGR